MQHIDKLVAELQARGITAHDIEDTVEALVRDRMLDTTHISLGAEDALSLLTECVAAETEALTAGGLPAQLAWMASYYNNADHLHWALSGYLRLPEMA